MRAAIAAVMILTVKVGSEASRDDEELASASASSWADATAA